MAEISPKLKQHQLEKEEKRIVKMNVPLERSNFSRSWYRKGRGKRNDELENKQTLSLSLSFGNLTLKVTI